MTHETQPWIFTPPEDPDASIIAIIGSKFHQTEVLTWGDTPGQIPGFYSDRIGSIFPKSSIRCWIPFPIFKNGI